MSNQDLKDEKYILLLEEQLRQMERDIQSFTTQSCGSICSLESLDDYLQEVNSYYYRTFHDSYFAEYRRTLQEDLNRSQVLAGHEELLIQHIAATIKRYAGLYNQIKAGLGKIRLLHDQAAQELQFLKGKNHRMILELMYGIKTLFENMQTLSQLSDGLVQLTLPQLGNPQDPEICGLAFRCLCSREGMQEDAIPRLNKVLKNFHYIESLLEQLKHPGPGIVVQDVLREIQHALQSSITSSPDTPWERFYLTQVVGRSKNNLDLLILNMETGRTTRVQQLLDDFQKHLSGWMLFLEQVIPWMPSPYFHLLPELFELETSHPGYLQELQHDIVSHRDAVEVIIQRFNAAVELDFNYFDEEVKKMLDFTAPFFASICNEPVFYPPLLDQHLHRVNLCLKSLTLQRETLEEEYWHYQNISNHIEKFLTGLREQMQLWSNILNDLERLLAPRNISRLWKGITIKLAHVPLYEGQPIPSEYEYLINKYHISTRLSDQEDNTILHQEGDFFIIQVEQLIVEEIPYLIISRKG